MASVCDEIMFPIDLCQSRVLCARTFKIQLKCTVFLRDDSTYPTTQKCDWQTTPTPTPHLNMMAHWLRILTRCHVISADCRGHAVGAGGAKTGETALSQWVKYPNMERICFFADKKSYAFAHGHRNKNKNKNKTFYLIYAHDKYTRQKQFCVFCYHPDLSRKAKARMKALDKERRHSKRDLEELGPRSRGPDVLVCISDWWWRPLGRAVLWWLEDSFVWGLMLTYQAYSLRGWFWDVSCKPNSSLYRYSCEPNTCQEIHRWASDHSGAVMRGLALNWTSQLTLDQKHVWWRSNWSYFVC